MFFAKPSLIIQVRNFWTVKRMNKRKITLVHIAFVTGLCVSGGLIFDTHQAKAQDSLLQKLPQVDDKSPLHLQADEVTYDNKNNRVSAAGNVEIYYNDYTLLADKVIYDQRKNTLSAEGNVRIKEPSGSVVSSDKITLTDDFREGFIRSLKIVTKDDIKIAAESAERIDENTTIFKKGSFTPCKTCKDKKEPLWKIKAYKIIHKKDEKNIYYEGASLELLGVPVAYLPYFSHPDPSVKRRSGFLVPKVSQSNELGFTTELPYFYNIAPNKDLTFSPRFTSEQGVLWKGEWRHRVKNGAYNIKLAGIDETNPDADTTGDGFRGSIETKGAFKISSWWNWGWDVTAETDETFRRVYELDNRVVTNRVSKVYLIGKSERNWFEANLYHFGALTSFDGSNAEAFVHPVIDYNYIFGSPILGGELSFDANVLSLSREDGADSNRLVTQLKWRRTIIDSLGQVYTPFMQARGDLYRATNVQDLITNEVGDDDYIARGQATAGLTYSFPFVSRTGSASHIIKPTAQIIARPDIVGDQNDVSNEDARSLVFDDTILFDTDKFSGYDRIETGVRANFGLEYTMQMYSGGYAKAVVGQSYQIAGENSFEEGTGLSKDKSDYVAGLYLEPSSNLTLISQARFDEDTLDVKRTDIYMRAGYGPVNTSINYANIDNEENLGILEDREEVLASGSIQISDYWSIYGSLRYNLVSEEFIEDSLGLKYADECFVLSVTYNESFIEDQDIDSDRSVLVRFELKHLGGTDFKTGINDDLIADSNDNKS